MNQKCKIKPTKIEKNLDFRDFSKIEKILDF